MKTNPINRLILAASIFSLLFTCGTSPSLQAASGTWTNTLGGSWNDTGNWSGGSIADGGDSTADFSTLDLFGDATVTLDGARTIGGLLFGDQGPDSNWFLNTGSGGPLTLDTTSGTPAVTVNNQTATLGVVLAGTKGLLKTGPGTLVLNGANTYTGGTTNQEGTLEVLAKGTGAMVYTVAQGATLNMGYNIAASYNNGIVLNGNGVSDSAGLYVKGGTSINLQNSLILQSQPTTVRAYGSGNATLNGFDINGTHLTVRSASSGSVIAPQLNIACNSYGYRVNVESGANTASGDLLIGGVISGSGNVTRAIPVNFHKYGAGSLRLTNVSTYAHGMNVAAGSAILSGGANRLPAGTGVALGNGTTSAKLVLQGVPQTLTALAVYGTGTANAVVGGSSTLSTLTLNTASGTTNSFAGILGGGGANENTLALIKLGTGRLVLNGANTFTGATTISAGTLALGAAGSLSGSSDIAVAAGAELDVIAAGGLVLGSGKTLSGAGTVRGNLTTVAGSVVTPAGMGTLGTLTLTNGNLTLSGGTLSVDVTPAASDVLAVNGNLDVTLPTVITVAGQPSNTTYTVATYTGTLTGLENLSAGGPRYTLDFSVTNQIRVVFSGTGGDLVWRGDGEANPWDNGWSSTWFNGATNDSFYAGDAVTFNDTATNLVVNLTGALSPASIAVSGASNYVFQGAGTLGGSAALTKTGSGVLTINNAGHQLGGGIHINGGVVQAHGGAWASSFFNSATPRAITVDSGGALETRTHSLGGLGATLNQPAITVNEGGTWTLNGEQYLSGDNLVLQGGAVNVATNDLRLQAGTVTVKTSAVPATVSGTVTLYGNATLSVQDGAAADDLRIGGVIAESGTGRSLTKTGAGTVVLTNNNTYSGATIISDGTLALVDTAALANSSPITVAAGGTLNVSSLASLFTLGAAQTLQGGGAVTGDVQSSSGSTIAPGGTNAIGTLQFNGDLTLAGNFDNLEFDLSKTPTTAGGTNNDSIVVASNLTINPYTVVNLNPIEVTYSGGTYQLLTYGGSLTGAGNTATWTLNGFTPSGRVTGASLSESPGAINLVVTGSPASLLWRGDGVANVWDEQTTANWLNGVTPDVFYAADAVTFDDSGTNTPSVDIQAPVQPSSVVVNGTKHYTLGSTFGYGIGGSGSLTKNGSGTLTLLSQHDYTGPTVINSGTLQLGDGSVNDGALTASPITNNATLVFNVAAAQTAATPIRGTGTVIQRGASYGSLTLDSGANSWSGGLNIESGTTRPGVNNALPAGKSVTISAGGAYDFNGINNGSSATRGYSFSIAGSGPSGEGALVNSGAGIFSWASVSNLTLTANATVGGANRWDIGSVTNSSVDGNGHVLTKVGANDISFRAHILTNLAALVVSNGNLFYEDYSRTNATTAGITNVVAPGATLGAWGSLTLNMPIVADGATIRNQGSGTPVWTGPVRLASDTVLGNALGSQVFAGTISGPGAAWIAGGGSTVTLTGTNTYAGGTVVSNGFFQLGNGGQCGSILGGITLAGGAFVVNCTNPVTLANNVTGDGGIRVRAVNGLTVNASAAINLGSGSLSVGKDSYGKLIVAGGGTVGAASMNVGDSTSVSGDVVQTGGTVTLTNELRVGHWPSEAGTYLIMGGTLNLTGAAASPGGERAGVVTIGVDGTGTLTQQGGNVNAYGIWLDNRTATAGADVWNLEGGTTTLGAGGIGSSNPGSVQVNLGGGTIVASNTWTSSIPMTLTGTNGDVTLNTAGNQITLGGVLSGGGGLVKAGSGTLTVTAANAYTGNTTVNGGTLAVAQATLSTNATVTVASGAILQLDFTTTNKVAALVLNGLSQPPGVYNNANAGAYILGGGSLEVPSTSVTPTPAKLTNSVAGNQLTLSWPAGEGWRLLAQTNPLAVGLTPATNAWYEVAPASSNTVTYTIGTTHPTVFFRLVYP